MFAIGKDEIDSSPALGKTSQCRDCGEMHEVQYGKTKNEADEWVESKTLAYISCPHSDSSYLVGIDGKDITRKLK